MKRMHILNRLAIILLLLGGCSEQAPKAPLQPSESDLKSLTIEGKQLHPYEQSDGGSSASTAKVSATAFSTSGSGTSVLLLVDANTAGTTALVNALTTAGCAVTVRPPPEYTWDATNPPLDDFHCVIHLNGATHSQALPVAAQTALVNFVQNGGGFIGSQWNGFERTIGQQVNMNDLVLQTWSDPPTGAGGGENCVRCNVTYTTVPAQASHPVLAGVSSPFTFMADGHDAGLQVVYGVDPSTVVMTVSSGRPGVLVREFGGGRVVNFSHAPNSSRGGSNTLQDPNIQQLYINAVNWACNRVIEVELDIKPTSCPNPLNTKSKGVLPVAVLGSASLDVNDIDVSTMQLNGVTPLRSSVEDVATPVANKQDVCDCTTDGPDGFDDLSLKFETQDIVASLGAVNDGDEVTLTLTGNLNDGTPIEGMDCVIIKKK